MGEKTGIAWTDSTWNPVRGCTKVSAGCKHCYAETFAERWRGVKGHAFEQGFDLRLVPEALTLPLHWRRPRRVFVNSMSDLFHEGVPDRFILQVFNVMREAHQHVFQVLTKRPARMADFCRRLRFDAGSAFGPGPDRAGGLWLVGGDEVGEVVRDAVNDKEIPGYGFSTVMRNLWLGVSVEDQRAADERIPELLATPAAVRFLSCEPLLGPVDIDAACVRAGRLGIHTGTIDWVIIGGESGPDARPCNAAWVRAISQRMQASLVPVFVKQLGAHVITRNDDGLSGCDYENDWQLADPDGQVEHDLNGYVDGYQGAPVRVHLTDRKGGDPAEWPADLRVQQFPEVTRG